MGCLKTDDMHWSVWLLSDQENCACQEPQIGGATRFQGLNARLVVFLYCSKPLRTYRKIDPLFFCNPLVAFKLVL